jgi:hypothetical protein
MSGAVGSLASYLPTLFGASGTDGTGASLLTTLYGYGAQSAGLGTTNPITALQNAERNQTKEIALTAAEPQVKRDVAAFRAAVTSAKTVTQLLANPTVMKVLLTANGLSDQLKYTALAQKALTSNVKDSKSLANQLSDTRWKTVAQTYDFANKGLSVIQNPKVLDTVANAYAEVTWRQSLDATTPGLSNALSFRDEASTITSVDQILGDPVMREVVTVALGIPKQIAFQPLEAQEKAISTRLDITKFADPKFTEGFVQRYLVAAAQNAGSTSASTPDIGTLAVQASGLVV